MVDVLNLHVSFDIAGILNFMINIPLFILAYKKISKTFFARTLFCVSMQALFLTIVPALSNPLVGELITSVLIGGIMAVYACGMILSAEHDGKLVVTSTLEEIQSGACIV